MKSKLTVRKFLLCIIVCTLTASAWAQPCLENWKYRVPITLDNTANPEPLVDIQYKIQLNTDSLFDLNLVKGDGGDIRILNGAGELLPLWIQDQTMLTDTTVIWVKVDNVPPNSEINIYLFYGNESANSVSNGDDTFLHFDHFNGEALDFGKWTYCGGGNGGTIPVVGNGEVTMTSSSATFNHFITSVQSFSGPFITEMKVNTANIGTGFLGHVNDQKDGYGMAFEEVSAVETIRLMSFDSDADTEKCIAKENQTPTNPASSPDVRGVWSYSWFERDNHALIFPGGTAQRTDELDTAAFHDDKQVVVGVMDNTGSISIDYIFTRTFVDAIPPHTFGTAVQLVDQLNVSTNAPICEGEQLELYAPTFAGVTYNWVGPNSFSSNAEDPIIPISDLDDVGKYVLTVITPSGCSPAYDSVIVSLDLVPEGGDVVFSRDHCLGEATGTLTNINRTGNVVQWEKADNIAGPWSIVPSTTDQLLYNNLQFDQFYRVKVESGTCGTDLSGIAEIRILDNSVGGVVLGGGQRVCEKDNFGFLNLTQEEGDILQWEKSTDDGQNWIVLTSTSNEISYTNLLDSTWYRAKVSNNNCPAVYSDTAKVFVMPIPELAFLADSTCSNVAAEFQNNSTISFGEISNYSWDFGDGAGSSVRNPIHQFNGPGGYIVQLSAESDYGCTSSMQAEITVHPLPQVAFDFEDICLGDSMLFNNLSNISGGSIVESEWNFGDGTTSNDLGNTGRTYVTPGQFIVQLTSHSNIGCLDSAMKTVTVYTPPQPDFSVQEVCHNEESIFINLTNSIESETTYLWIFGDGNTSTERSPRHEYADAGRFPVRLEATSYNQCFNAITDTVVINPNPIANFNFEERCENEMVTFSNNSSLEEGEVFYVWEVDGVGVSGETNLEHTFPNFGSYGVKLKASSLKGCKDEVTKMVQSHALPIPNFQIESTCFQAPMDLFNNSTIPLGTIESYLWSFGNGDSSTEETPVYIYDSIGNYSIQLVATSDFGCVDSVVKSADIHISPLPNTSFINDVVCLGNPTSFTNQTSITEGGVDDFVWDLGDGNTALSQNVIHEYENPGTYQVNLLARSDQGCIKDTTIEVEVYDTPITKFEVNNACQNATVFVTNNSTIGIGSMSYTWNLDGFIVQMGQNSFDTIFAMAGNHELVLTAISDNNCSSETSKNFEVFALPFVDAGRDTSGSFGYPFNLNGYAPTARSFVWSPGGEVEDVFSLSTVVTPTENTVFTLTVEDENGCSASDQIEITLIEDFKLRVTNVVTPNGDGVNDTWKIHNAHLYDGNISVSIFDEWGALLFSADNYDEEWGGSAGFDELPDGTYYYVIGFESNDRIYKGTVTILR